MWAVRPAGERGRTEFGWLNSAHSFSFAQYFDPKHMGVSALRVLNDDYVAPKGGFDTHGHSNMEILTYVLEGTIAHRDSMGNVEHLAAGEMQLMSAGTGIRHSEFNPSDSESLHFLQIWLHPNEHNVTPRYQQRGFARTSAIQAVVTPDGAGGTLSIHQDARVLLVRLDKEEAVGALQVDRTYYVHVIDGPMSITIGVDQIVLQSGDAVALCGEEVLRFASETQSQAIMFDLP